MAKKSTARRGVENTGGPGKAPADGGQPSDSVAPARLALSAGNVRRARSLARQVADAGPEGERLEATSILDRTRPDPRSLVITLAVIALILFAAWAAILRAH